MRWHPLLLLCFVTAWSATESYRILAVMPLKASHGILADALVRHLADAGHQVTFILGTPWKKPHPNVTEVYPVANEEEDDTEHDLEYLIKYRTLFDVFVGFLVQMGMPHLNANYVKDPRVQEFLMDPNQKFDLVIAEWMFTEIYASFAAVYQCPLIFLSTTHPHWQVTELIDEALNPAYNSDIQSTQIPPFSFTQRAYQLFLQLSRSVVKPFVGIYERYVYNTAIVPILEKHGKPVPAYSDVIANISLIFGNTHASLGEAVRLPQNFKPIGGFHVSNEVKPLPDDMKKILDNAKHGLIYFSLGSNAKSKNIPRSIKDGVLKMFGKLKQTVIWKLEEVWPELPPNVHIVNWAPQQSILAHNNTVLFISHGGLLSMTETIHHGKPIIGVPIFADQSLNVRAAERKGFGKQVHLDYDMPENLGAAINEMVNNPRYAEKAKYWSQIYYDRLATPAQELVYWTEYVIRTGGAPHLRSIAFDVPWYQKLYLDLIIFSAISSVVLRKLMKLAFRKWYSNKSKSKKE